MRGISTSCLHLKRRRIRISLLLNSIHRSRRSSSNHHKLLHTMRMNKMHPKPQAASHDAHERDAPKVLMIKIVAVQHIIPNERICLEAQYCS